MLGRERSMSARPAVSVITTFLNAERFLAETIESVLAQDFPAFEYLLVDDGSTDGSSAIARDCAAWHPRRVRYLEHPDHQNRGPSASRNLAGRVARGTMLAYVDADDRWQPDKLDRQIDIMAAHPEVGLVCGASEYWYSWANEPEGKDRVIQVGARQDEVLRPPEAMLALYPLGTGAAPVPSGLMVRRSLVEAIGGWEESYLGPYQLYEDQAFLAKIYLSAPIYVASACFDQYRQHPDSCVSRARRNDQYHLVRRHFLEWLEAYLKREGIPDPRVHRALRRALMPYRHPTLGEFKSTVGWLPRLSRHAVVRRFRTRD
jgi:glycosyltransferase involved in cell wall biosynthesis